MNSFLGSPVFWLTAFLIDRITTFYKCVTSASRAKQSEEREAPVDTNPKSPERKVIHHTHEQCNGSVRENGSPSTKNWAVSTGYVGKAWEVSVQVYMRTDKSRTLKSIYELRIQPGYGCLLKVYSVHPSFWLSVLILFIFRSDDSDSDSGRVRNDTKC